MTSHKTMWALSVGAVMALHTPAWAETPDGETDTTPNPPVARVHPKDVGPTTVNQPGWDKDWGFVFSLNNVLTQANIVSSYLGFGAGGIYVLNSRMSIRGGLTLFHQHNPASISKTTTSTAGNVTVAHTLVPPAGACTAFTTTGCTTAFTLGLGGDFLLRLIPNEFSPYFGAGARLVYDFREVSYSDDASVVNQITSVDNEIRTASLGAVGIAGVEWRLHDTFAFFAEYQLGITLLSFERQRDSTVLEVNVGGNQQSATQTRRDQERTTYFNTNLGLAHGALLGLIGFFD